MAVRMINNTSEIPGALVPQSLDKANSHKSLGDHVKKVGAVAMEAVDFFEDNMWTYVHEGRKLCKGVFGVVKNVVPQSAGHMGPMSDGLGLFSLVGFAFALKAVPKHVKDVVTSVRLRDIEGVALSAIGNVVNAADALDSWMTFHGALSAMGLIPQVALFSTIALPVAVFLMSSGTVLGAYKSVWNFVELYKMRNVTKIDNTDEMVEYLRQKIGATKEEKEAIVAKLKAKGLEDDELKMEKTKQLQRLKMRKRKIVARHHGDARVVNIMRNAKQGLQAGTIDLDRALVGMHDVKRLTAIHGAVNTTSAAVTATMLGTVVASAATPIPVLVVPIVGIGKAAFSIGKFFFVKKCVGKFIDDKELAKPFVKAA